MAPDGTSRVASGNGRGPLTVADGSPIRDATLLLRVGWAAHWSSPDSCERISQGNLIRTGRLSLPEWWARDLVTGQPKPGSDSPLGWGPPRRGGDGEAVGKCSATQPRVPSGHLVKNRSHGTDDGIAAVRLGQEVHALRCQCRLIQVVPREPRYIQDRQVLPG